MARDMMIDVASEIKSDGVSLVRVTPDNFRELWPMFKGLLEEACERSSGRFDSDSSIKNMLDGKWQFWVGQHGDGIAALGVTELLEYPSGLKVGNVVIATGDSSSKWKHLMGDLKEWARQEGCHKMQTWARKGWARKLDDFKLTHVLLEVDL